jgi:hypothetical protein
MVRPRAFATGGHAGRRQSSALPRREEQIMPRYIIERTIPNAASLTQDDLSAIARKSCDVVNELGRPYTWHHSYVAGDKVFCIHEAESEEVVREHSRRGGFPVDRVTEIAATMTPELAGRAAART